MPDPTESPSDKVRLVFIDAATGDHFRMGTESRPDSLIAGRSRTVSNAHELEMPVARFHELQERGELGFRPKGAIADVRIYLVVDEAAHGGGEVIEALRAELAALHRRHDEGIAALGKELDEVRGQSPEGVKGGLSEDDLACLRERDALITLLLPHVEDEQNDTPVGVLSRILATLPVKQEPPAPEDTPPPSGDEKPPAESATPVRKAAAEEGTPVEFDQRAYVAALPKDLPGLRGLAAPAGIVGAANMNAAQLRNALLRYEIARHATLPA